MKMNKTFLIYILILLSLISCSKANLIPASQTPTVTELEGNGTRTPTTSISILPTSFPIGDGGLITGKPCTAPCFFGVYPGETPFDQTFTILSNYGRNSCKQNTTELTILCDKRNFIGANLSTRLINRIGFYPQIAVSVEEIILKYGNPSSLQIFIGGIPEAPMISMLLLFDDLNMRIHLPEKEGTEYIIEKTTKIELINYFDNELYSKVNEDEFSQLWNGYGTYKQ
jgi:hypothetical protein